MRRLDYRHNKQYMNHSTDKLKSCLFTRRIGRVVIPSSKACSAAYWSNKNSARSTSGAYTEPARTHRSSTSRQTESYTRSP
ncbi:hypothetical protein SDJN02_19715, partial [Cucurbita argyrosperma subsp. argyrosperma]